MKENMNELIMNKLVENIELISGKIAERYEGVKPFDRKLPSPKALRDIFSRLSDRVAQKNEEMGQWR